MSSRSLDLLQAGPKQFLFCFLPPEAPAYSAVSHPLFPWCWMLGATPAVLEHLALTDQHKINHSPLHLPLPFCSPNTGMHCLVSHPEAQTLLYSSQISG